MRFATCPAALTLAALLTAPTLGQFNADKVALYSNIPLSSFGASSGNDCWGYTSPSGREYAIMGLNDRVAFVEITNPANPVILDLITHPNSTWGDIKVHQEYAYVVNETGGGIQVIDMGDIDNGNVTLVNTVSQPADTHNIAIDTDSGFLYCCIPNTNGGRVVAFNLSNPASPVLAGQMSSQNGGDPVHDAQIVTFFDGPYQGRQILYGSGEGRGLDIYDVTNKSNMFRVSRTSYPNVAYAHQCWLSEDRNYVYLNDELDGIQRTLVFDVSDINDPVLVNEFTTGLSAIDHNLYVHGGFIFEANYHSGLRVFDACDPVNPTEVGFFDTYPPDDGNGFDGAWSTYPFFPSGTVIVSDTVRGLFVLDPSEALAGNLGFAYPDGRPGFVDPSGGTLMRVNVSGCSAEPEPGTGVFHVDTGQGFVDLPMNHLGNNEYEAVFPPSNCGSIVRFFVSAESTDGGTFTDPDGAPGEFYTSISSSDQILAFEDDFETNQGWSVSGDAFDGQWDRGVPIGGGDRGDPPTDADGSGQCYLTDNEDGNSDVDGGSTILTSPTLDATGGEAFISYYRWYSNDTGNAPNQDIFVIDISNNDGASWVNLETVGPSGPGTSGGWFFKSFRIADVITPTSQMRIRFNASDLGEGSVVEAGVDGVAVTILVCDSTQLVDFNIAFGTLLSGGLAELLNSDDQFLKARSSFGFTAFEPNVMDLVVGASTTLQSHTSVDLSVESKINNPGGTLKVRLRNWSNGVFDQVGSFGVGTTESVHTVNGVASASYVRAADGRVEMSARYVVLAAFSLLGFDASVDRTQVTVN